MLNKLIITMMPIVPKAIIKKVASKYIAGPKLEDAIRVTKEFEAKGGTTTIDVLGEFVTERERALHETEMSSKVLSAIKDNQIKTYLSIKPTSLGLDVDFDFAYTNISGIIRKANENNIFVRIDMENSPYTDKTFEIFKKLRAEGLDNVGLVIQAMMRRSADDLKMLAPYKPFIRLCKGIYREAPEIAYQGKEEVRDNYKKLFRFMVDNEFKLGIATHDEPLIQFALDEIEKTKLPQERYEFQMLLGVREERRDSILRAGHKMRIYCPFGEDWYGYSTRRLKENPAMAGMIFKAIFFKG